MIRDHDREEAVKEKKKQSLKIGIRTHHCYDNYELTQQLSLPAGTEPTYFRPAQQSEMAFPSE